MPHHNRDRKLTRATLCAAVATLWIIADNGMAFAGDDDLLPDQKFIQGIMRGLGLRNGAEEQIEYKERPPLVVPPSRDLPPPVTTGSIAARDPAWPVDPDLQEKAAARKANAERKPIDWIAAGDPLKPDELAAGKTAAAPNEKPLPSAETAGGPMSPSELGYAGGLWADLKNFSNSFNKDKPPETAKFIREPARSSLTDPPSGYRTPSPDQPYGVHITADRAKAQSAEDRQTVGTQR